MAVMKRPEGIFPYVTTPKYGENLYEAVANTCSEFGVIPPPQEAITEGLAPALGDAEVRKLVETRRGKRVLAPNAFREVTAAGEKVLLLICEAHGAAVVPWDLNDRTVGAWTPPTAEAMHRVKELVAAELAVQQAEKHKRLAEMERDARGRAGSDEPHAAASLAAADDKYRLTVKALNEAERERDRLLSSLGHRRPRPTVRPAECDGKPAAAFALAPQPREVAVHLQRYAETSLRKAGKRRGYDLIESLVASGQLSRGMCALQQWQLTQPDGTTTRLWRMVAVTANNRALARLDIYGLRPEHLVTGVPQPALSLPGENPDPTLLFLNQREVLNRLSQRLNAARASEDTEQDHAAFRAAKITTVPMEVVIGCSNPAALEHVLRTLNVDDHLRGVQPYDEDARLIALWAMLVDAYASEKKLVSALEEAFPDSRAGGQLEADSVRAALTGNGPLTALAALLPLEEEATPAALRDIAIRAITALVFPLVPEAPAEPTRRKWRNTGVYWPIVQTALEEPAWSGIRAPAAAARTRLWSAAVAQLFLQRGNILSALGMFGVSDAKEGARQDPRSVSKLLLEAEAGGAAAWSALAERMVPNLIHGPESLITSGQGSEAGEQRKGIRRTPSNAVAALKMAYDHKSESLTRELLLAFAKAVIAHPDASTAPVAPDGSEPTCYGEQHLLPASRTPIVPGMILVPDSDGNPTPLVVDKAWFDATFPPDLAKADEPPAAGDAEEEGDGQAGGAVGASSQDTARVTENVAEDPRTSLENLRRELPARIDLTAGAYERAVQSAEALMSDLERARALRSQLDEQHLTSDQRIEWMEKLAKARSAAEGSVSAMQQFEQLILGL